MCSHTHSSVSPRRERVSGFCSILRFTSFSSEAVSVKVNNRNTFYGLITDLVPQLSKQTTKESNRLLKYFPTKSAPNDRSSRCGCHSSIIHKPSRTEGDTNEESHHRFDLMFEPRDLLGSLLQHPHLILLNWIVILFCFVSPLQSLPPLLLKPLIYKINRLHDVTRLLPVRFPLIWFTFCSLIMQWNQITVITRSYSSCNTAEKYSALLFQRQKLIFKQFCIEMVVICVNIQHSAVVGCDCSLFCLKTKQLLHLNGWNQTKSL